MRWAMIDAEAEDLIIIYPVLLSGGRFAKLHLPRDLTPEEADKIARIVASLAALNG